MKGHTDSVVTVVATSDNKYIISGSWDKTIRIWNLLEKRQETFFYFNESIISGSWQRIQFNSNFWKWPSKKSWFKEINKILVYI